mmetsp:Transcript_34889/g.137879  ORF Transcript_34889/g.137879 Transcript_34889/m.137879 type:complete len:166 (-) Transcript_34889:2238-2735(-)
MEGNQILWTAKFLLRLSRMSLWLMCSPESCFSAGRLTLVHGVRPFLLEFSDDPEHTIAEAFKVLVSRGWLESGDLVIIVADVLGGRSGAPDSEKRAVFDEVAEGSAEISSSRVRAALRKMSLKATDTVEFKLAHGDTGTISYEEFAEVASNAKQIVHTVQLRYCP